MCFLQNDFLVKGTLAVGRNCWCRLGLLLLVGTVGDGREYCGWCDVEGTIDVGLDYVDYCGLACWIVTINGQRKKHIVLLTDG